MFAVLYDQSLRSMDTDPQSQVGRPRDPVAAIEWEAALKRQALARRAHPSPDGDYERLQNSYRDLVGPLPAPAQRGCRGQRPTAFTLIAPSQALGYE